MKRAILSIIAVLMLGCMLQSCIIVSVNEDEEEIGRWDPIVVNKDEVRFSLYGGVDSVWITKNYSSWWICDIENNGEYYNPETECDTTVSDAPTIIDGFFNGLKAEIPSYSRKKVIITVQPSESPRTWNIEMECGDAFKQIKVVQE